MEKQKSYLNFVEHIDITGKKKTKVFSVLNTSGYVLGLIKWYSPWRKYCFFILNDDLIFDYLCLNEISNFICILMEERKKIKFKLVASINNL